MIKFSIDTFPKSMDFRFCNDYVARLIKGAISEPLLKLERDGEKFKIEDGICHLEKENPRKCVLKLKSWHFANGEVVSTQNIKNSIEWQLQNNPKAADLLRTYKRIKKEGEKLVIIHKKDKFFVRKLSNPVFSPFLENNIFCGYFQISKIVDGQSILLSSNKYNATKDQNVKFVLIKDNVEDVKLFKEKKTDFTSNTTFPLAFQNEFIKLHVQKNFITFFLSFANRKLLAKEFDEDRKWLSEAIDRDEIQNSLSPMLRSTCCNSQAKAREKLFGKKNLVLGYDDFYPNKQICQIIQRQLRKKNIEVELQETNFHERNSENVDLQLNLYMHEMLLDDEFYLSSYYSLLLKLHDMEVSKKFSKWQKKYISTKKPKFLQKMKGIFENLHMEICLFDQNSIYLTNFDEFDFNVLNYECFLK